ncbi:MAG TPA: 5-bromo-4-chloroindolyl phosphate hydrolysis family protein [Atopostipes sp.]|nr:5-bromo-4-chloroindolyl phosphate hydrolysis family protein [Atopostipes sp.]
MKKKTSNNLVMLLLAVFTVIVVIFLLGALNVNRTFSVIIGILVGFVLYSKYISQQKPKRKAKKELQPVSKEREQFYLSRGLSEEDIQFFRETMNNAKIQILQIEENVNQVGKLKAIANRNNTLNLIKVLFKDIVNEPERLHEVDQFLYVHLPSLAELTTKYVQINQHQAKSKQTFDVLEKSARTIDEMCQQISKDYVNFRSTDISGLADEVELAKKRLNREGSNIEDDEI